MKITLLLLVIGFFFELLIVPFPRNPSEHLYPYWIISLFHVGVAVVAYVTYFFTLGSFVKEDDWKVSDELMAVFGLMLIIGVGQWAIRPVIYSNKDLSFYYLFEEVWHACVSGGLIYLLVTLVNINFLTRKHIQESIRFNPAIHPLEEGLVSIKTQNLSDDFDLKPDSFVCAKADGNYLNIYMMDGDETSAELKRITLQSLCDQLVDYHFIVKTHRGYLVNINFITNISGNAQGFVLNMASLDFSIPVSRKHLNVFRSLMN